jgi:hypothetical protein
MDFNRSSYDFAAELIDIWHLHNSEKLPAGPSVFFEPSPLTAVQKVRPDLLSAPSAPLR